jgi:AcrR family transcriptional regulator
VPDEIPAKPAPSNPTHRDRLLAAMTDAVADLGYEATTVAQVIAYAGVGRATFYEHFTDKDDCFTAALHESTTQLARRLRRAAKAADNAPHAVGSALDQLLTSLSSNPAHGTLLFIAARAAAPTAASPLLSEFDPLVSGSRSGNAKPAFDISPVALLGGIATVISSRLTNSAADQLPDLRDDLLAWARTYVVPSSASRWSTSPDAVLAAVPALEPAPSIAPIPPRPDHLPRGRRTLPQSVVTRNHRTRVLYAVAELAEQKGYAATGITELAQAASISRQVLYDHFADKQDAAIRTQRFIYRYASEGTRAAYFAASTWPQRVWNSLLWLTTLISEQPAFSRLAIVEPYAIGPLAIANLEDALSTSTGILEEGYHQTKTATPPPRLYSQATIGAIFEVIRHHITQGSTEELRRHLPELTYLAIAPFVGATAAGELVREIAG